ncbi:MAG TPA: hypothetical protein VNK24_07050 [Elusimicrobiota bacterium]|nr:hypothetical protein [Elusimicrobiota bacterium]
MTIALLPLIALLGKSPVWAGQDSGLSEAFSKISSEIKRAPVNSGISKAANPTRHFIGPGGLVRLDVFVCAGSGISDSTVTKDIKRVSKALSQCGLKVAAPATPYPRFSLPDGRCDLETGEDSPRLSDQERELVSKYHDGRSGVLTAFYLSWDSESPNEAGTSLPSDYLGEVKTSESASFLKRAVGAFFIFQKARDTMANASYTLPHEMVHILTESSAHLHAPKDSMNLMYRPIGYASPDSVQGDALTRAQCARIWEVSGQP